MKYIFKAIVLLSLLQSCNSQEQSNYNLNEIKLGGNDLHGELYRKKYQKPSDSKIKYNRWEGYEVSSNHEIEFLLKSNPNCEAIRITHWNHDTLNNFILTDKIGEFEKLKFLEIHSNRITAYPKEIENLTTLEEIVLQVSQKKEIEFNFSKFNNLKHLTIHFADNLGVFPYSIFDCKKLESLKLFRFFLSDDNVLSGIEKLTNLKELYIWDSNLVLPQNGNYNFEALETLIIDRMSTPLPEYFYKNKTLKRMALSSLFDTLDLSKLSNIKSLESLSLSYQNKFVGQLSLPKLENLYISEYRGSDIDIDFKELKALTSLTVWGCPKIEGLRELSGNSLRSIVIVNNEKLKRIKYNPKKLKNIEEIVLRFNKSLENRPAEINNVPVKEIETNKG